MAQSAALLLLGFWANVVLVLYTAWTAFREDYGVVELGASDLLKVGEKGEGARGGRRMGARELGKLCSYVVCSYNEAPFASPV